MQPAPQNNLLPSGYYRGKIIGYGIKKTRKGDPAPTIAWEVLAPDGSKRKVFWQGSWQGRGMDITMEALMCCGLSTPSDLRRLVEGPASGVLNMRDYFDLSIELESGSDGKSYNKVQWINSESRIKDAMAPEEFAWQVENRGLEDELIRVAIEKGYNLKGPAQFEPQQSSNSLSVSDAFAPRPDDLPF